MTRRDQHRLDDQAWRALAEQLRARQQFFGRLTLDGVGLTTAYYLDEEASPNRRVRPLQATRLRRGRGARWRRGTTPGA